MTRWVIVGTVAALSCLFPLAIAYDLPREHALRWIRNSTNCSVFYTCFVPFAAGLFYASINWPAVRQLALTMKIFLITTFIFAFVITIPDA